MSPLRHVESEVENHVQAITFDRRDICLIEAVDPSLAHRHDVDHFRASEERMNIGWMEGCSEVRAQAFVDSHIQTPEKRAKPC